MNFSMGEKKIARVKKIRDSVQSREEVAAINVSIHEQHFSVWRQKKCSHNQNLRCDRESQRG